MNHQEDKDQAALYEWAAYIPELLWMHAIPNGVFLHGNKIQRARQMARLKKQGLRPGVWDNFLPLARGKYHGLYIEMKVGKNKLTDGQSKFGTYAVNQNYKCVVCYGVEQAIKAVEDYLKL